MLLIITSILPCHQHVSALKGYETYLISRKNVSQIMASDDALSYLKGRQMGKTMSFFPHHPCLRISCLSLSHLVIYEPRAHIHIVPFPLTQRGVRDFAAFVWWPTSVVFHRASEGWTTHLRCGEEMDCPVL